MDEVKVQAIRDWFVIKYATKLDLTYEKIRQQVRDGSTRKYWLEDDLLKWIGYPSEEQNLALLSRSYYWLKMGYGG
ncbi:hypothetical protein AAG906_032994 [Vitis piasezkii]